MMFVKWKVTKTIQWLVKLFLIYLFIFTSFRVATVVFFKPADMAYTALGKSFWLGLKYDLRWISIVLLPIPVLSMVKRFSPFYSETSKKVWTIYLGIITLFVLFIYGADFGQFAYINARLNADALIFAEDPKESLQMIWQSYPIVWILIALIGAVLMMVWMFRRTHVSVEDRNSNIHKFSYRKRWHGVALLLMAWFMYGFLTEKPLDFFRAFNLNDEFKSNLALNPMQNFFTTLGFRKPATNTKEKQYFGFMQSYLGLDKTVSKGYTRLVHPNSKALESSPNVVLVICESFSMYKSTMSGNVLNSTPYFDNMCKEGIFFNRCFSPTFGTARGVYAIITGIPDVQLGKFSTRNEEAVNQRTIINDFEGYDKNYFIGGSSEFNNFRGLVQNIKNVNIYEEGKYTSPKLNVWGISDKNLFLEANAVMAKATKPFFTIIQTADNHRPYNLPEEDKDFVVKNISLEELKKNGFESLKEYNAFTYQDYCFKKFMDAARKEKYYNNTIFVFVGDHGLEGNASAVYPKAWNDQRLADEHIPLLIYAPALLTPQVHNEPVSQIDVLPTIASLIQQPYTNSTLGRDLLDSAKTPHEAFIIYHAPGWVGVVNDKYFYRKNIHMENNKPDVKDGKPKILEELVSVTSAPINLNAQQLDSVKKAMALSTNAVYETAKWMLINNKGK
jgi:phosphoglycerol transferase MdoB-like AlkP superfamily enzyme